MSGTIGGPVRLGIQITLQNQQALQGFAQMRQAISQLNVQFEGLDMQLRSVDRIIKYMAAGALVGLVAQFVRTSAELERLNILLVTTEGTFARANARMDQLVQIASNAPFSLNTITDAFVKLRTAGIEPIVGSGGQGPLQALIDGVAAFGGTDQQFQRATLAIQQMAGKGTISLEELRQQLGEAIPTAMRLMAEGLGMTTAQLISEITKGNIEATRGINALTTVLEQKYGGAARLLSMTMSGAFRQIITEIDRVSLELQRGGVFDVITIALQRLRDMIKSVSDSMANGGIASAFRELYEWIDANSYAIARFLTAFRAFGQALGLIASGIYDLIKELPAEALAGGLIGLILFGRLGMITGALAGTISEVVTVVAGLIGSLMSMVGSFAGALGLEINQFITLGVIGAILFGRIGIVAVALVGIADQVIGGIRRRLAEFVAWAVGLGAQVQEFFTNFSPSGAVEAGRNARDGFMRDNASQPSQSFWGFGDTRTTPMGELFNQAGNAARVNASQVEAFTARMQAAIQAIGESRREFENRFGTPNEASGLTTAEISKVNELTTSYERMRDRLASLTGREIDGYLSARRRDLESLQGVIDTVRQRADAADAAGNSVQAGQLRREQQALEGQAANFRRVIDEISRAADGRIGARTGLILERYGNQLTQIREQLEAASAEFTGGRRSEDSEVERMQARFAATARQLANMRAQVEATRGSEAARSGTLAEITRLQGELNRVTEEGVAIARRKAAREREDLLTDSGRRMTDIQSQFQREMLNQSTNPIGNEQALGVLSRREGYQQQLRQIGDQLQTLQRRREDMGAGVEPWVEGQIQGLQMVQEQYQRFYDNVGTFQEESTNRAKELWKSVADTIQDGIGRGLEMLVTRTGTLKDVMEDMYRSITRAAINYLMQMAMFQVGSMVAGAAGAGATGGTFSPMKAAANFFSGGPANGGIKSAFGNVFNNGAVQRFAAGGAFTNRVVAGPTLFNMGEMGEAGPEGILPLTKIGGKLGVHAKGGGDHITFNIQALDASSVRELLYREGSAIVGTINSRNRLNRGYRG
jgi:tape measure domain-containing protein